MKRMLQLLAIMVLVSIAGSGCGDSQQKGINSGKDKPKTSEKQG
ncbi:MAG TPA: hypothetical protein VK395_31580 [Gemmataceae bacterium]|nr:hypothetical protein [Gemmataceae bacterium]